MITKDFLKEIKFLGTDNDFVMLITTKYYKNLPAANFRISNQIPGWIYITVSTDDEYHPFVAKYGLNTVERYLVILGASDKYNHGE
jgi:hypothetical protein